VPPSGARTAAGRKARGPSVEGMANRSPWLQPGPAKRCARLAVVWGVLALFAAVIAVVFVEAPVWGRICEALAAVALGAVAVAYYASYRVHAREGLPG
jgi:Flp pilus assembly protein TadB